MPVRNDAATLEAALGAVLDQDYPGALEVVLAVGPSEDGTNELAERLAGRDQRVRIVANPAGTTPAALNRAIAAAKGSVVARVDAHALLTPRYLRRAVELLEQTGADNVGGVQQAEGETPFQHAVAAAMTSRFGVGNARFHYGGRPGPVDTVYLGVFPKTTLERLGGYDESLLRNQDYELNWRIRAAGGTVWFDPDLRVRYRPRSTLSALARQYYEYGWWKREVVRQHPRSLRLRQLAAPVAVSANVAALLASRWDRRALLVPRCYLLATAGASLLGSRRLTGRSRLWLPVVFVTMHAAWGSGFLAAMVAAPRTHPRGNDPAIPAPS
jgi:succinoglycan biosynthesis protein ExoA